MLAVLLFPPHIKNLIHEWLDSFHMSYMKW